MPFEFFIAKRYFLTKQRTGFLSLIAYFSISGIIIGVAALVISLSVMNGFEKEIRSSIIGFDGHIRLRSFHDKGMPYPNHDLDKLAKIDHIAEISPYIFNKGLIIGGNNLDGILIKGVESKTVVNVTKIGDYIIEGALSLDTVHVEENSNGYPGIVLGNSIASRLEIKLHDKIFIASFPQNTDISNPRQPVLKPFIVSGIFETGLYDYDNNFGYLSISSAQNLFNTGSRISGFEIKLDDWQAETLRTVAKEISDTFGYPYMAETWFERNRPVFAWMQIQKWVAFIVLSLIIIVAAFNIISNLIMVVMEKKNEIGILKSIGTRSNSIMKIFVFQGLISGIIGTIFGCLTGYLLCLGQIHYKWFSLDADVYFINSLPIEMKSFDFFLVAFFSIFLSLIATIYPSWKAAKLDPVQAISLID